MEPITEADTVQALQSSVPLFDPSQLPLRQWCAGSREDPLTGLIAFPDFHSYLPSVLTAALKAGGMVGLAIGDVDGLKQHVEDANSGDPASFGHLAGNRVMAGVGATTRTWFHQQPWAHGCVATFGGDEVIVAAQIDDIETFHTAICGLRDRLRRALPVPVSFAFVVVGAEHLPAERQGNGWAHSFTDALLAVADRCLFAHKALRRQIGGAGGIVALTHPAGPSVSQTLAALPTAPGELVHAVARPSTVQDRELYLLPFLGPQGQRGRPFRITFANGRSVTQAVISVHGQAAITAPAGTGETDIAVTLQPLRTQVPHQLPEDLIAALELHSLDWHALPDHERAQLLHLIRESAAPNIRLQRIGAAIAAVGAHQGRPA